MTSNPSKIQKKADADEMLGGLAVATAGGISFDPKTRENTLNMVGAVLSNDEGGSRKRRSAAVAAVDLKTPPEVSR